MKLEELGRRAVACPRWRWLPGMAILGSKGRRVVVVGLSGVPEATSGMNSRAIEPDELPDLSAPATLGCLLHLVREAWGSPMLATVQERGMGWIVADSLCNAMLADRRYFRGTNEPEALVAALEAAQ